MTFTFSSIRAANEIAAALGHGCALRPQAEDLLLVAREGEEMCEGDITPSSRWGPTEAVWMTHAHLMIQVSDLSSAAALSGDINVIVGHVAADDGNLAVMCFEVGPDHARRVSRWVVLDRRPAMPDPLAGIATLAELAAAWERAADECDGGGGLRCVRWTTERVQTIEYATTDEALMRARRRWVGASHRRDRAEAVADAAGEAHRTWASSGASPYRHSTSEQDEHNAPVLVALERCAAARDAVADAEQAVAECVRPITALRHTTASGSGRLHISVRAESVTLAVTAGGPDRHYVDPASVAEYDQAQAHLARLLSEFRSLSDDASETAVLSFERDIRLDCARVESFVDPERRVTLRIRFDDTGAEVITLRPDMLCNHPDGAELIHYLGRECPALAEALAGLADVHPVVDALVVFDDARRAFWSAEQGVRDLCWTPTPTPTPPPAPSTSVGETEQESV